MHYCTISDVAAVQGALDNTPDHKLRSANVFNGGQVIFTATSWALQRPWDVTINRKEIKARISNLPIFESCLDLLFLLFLISLKTSSSSASKLDSRVWCDGICYIAGNVDNCGSIIHAHSAKMMLVLVLHPPSVATRMRRSARRLRSMYTPVSSYCSACLLRGPLSLSASPFLRHGTSDFQMFKFLLYQSLLPLLLTASSIATSPSSSSCSSFGGATALVNL